MTVFDKAKSFAEEMTSVLCKYEIDVKVDEDQHHEAKYTFIVSHDNTTVELGIDDIIY